MANGSGYKALCAAVADAIQLGSNSGLRVSELCLGTMNFGQPGRGHQGDWTLGPDAARPIFKAALDQGLFYFELARKYGKAPAQISVAWLLNKPEVYAPVVGVSRIEQLEQLVDAADIELAADDVTYLEELYQPVENLLSIGYS